MTELTDHPASDSSARLASVYARVRDALSSASRAPDDAVVVAVSKQQPAEALQAAYRAGQRHFGESYVQEAVAKMDRLDAPEAVWHFIGRIQANKTRAIAERFDWVHTVDRERSARRLSEQRPRFAAPLNVLIQVNLAGETQKAGVEGARVPELAQTIRDLPRLKLRGLMAIPPAHLDDAAALAYFRGLKALFDGVAGAGHDMDTLSMGMSGDFETAIAAGSNCVRIGTAIFGPRSVAP